MQRFALFMGILILGTLILGACAEESKPEEAIESYLKAQISGNADKLVSLSCPAWEADAKTAAASFQSVDASTEGLKCSKTGADGDYTLITCEGTIVIQYRGEDPRSQSLPDLTYRAIKLDDKWKMCGTQN